MTAAPDATSPASQVGDDHGSFSQEAKIPTAQEDWPVLDPEAPELAQVAQCLAMCIREVPGWADSASLITAHCHATVLAQDLAALPDASQSGMSEANAPIPAVQSGAVAWLLEWRDEREEPHDRRRVQLSPALDLWMKPYEVKITALGILPQSEPLPGGVGEARARIQAAIADLQGEHEAMAGPFDPESWSVDVRVSDLEAILAALSGKEQG